MTARLPENLDLIATAPDGIRKLRGLILELAVRGKLVAQDPDDEPASELLKCVDVERRQLKIPPQPPADDPLGPFSLPDGWEWVYFGDVAQHNSGKTLDKGRNTGHSRRYITTSNLYWGRFDLANVHEMPIRDEELERCTARRNDLLICEGGEAGRAAVWDADEEICFQNHVHRARFFAGINPYYAYRIFQRLDLSGEINQFRKGVGISNLSGKTLASIPFPLPPLTEQHRIVAKVDELMALCDRLESEQADGEAAHARLVDTLLGTLTQSADAADLAANWQRLAGHFDTLFSTEASLDALKQTILQLAVMGKLVPQNPNDEPASELLKRIAKERARLEAEGVCKKLKPLPPMVDHECPFDVPRSWAWVYFGAIAETRLGKMLDAAKNRGELKPYLRNTNVQWWQFDFDDIKELRLTEDELDEFRLASGDLLICEGGEPGRCAIWRSEIDEMYFQKALHRARPIGGCISEYLQIVLRQDAISGVLSAYFTGATIKHFPGDKLNRYAMPLPPLAEQHRIVAKVDELLALVDRLKAGLAESRRRQERLASTLINSALAAA